LINTWHLNQYQYKYNCFFLIHNFNNHSNICFIDTQLNGRKRKKTDNVYYWQLKLTLEMNQYNDILQTNASCYQYTY